MNTIHSITLGPEWPPKRGWFSGYPSRTTHYYELDIQLNDTFGGTNQAYQPEITPTNWRYICWTRRQDNRFNRCVVQHPLCGSNVRMTYLYRDRRPHCIRCTAKMNRKHR